MIVYYQQYVLVVAICVGSASKKMTLAALYFFYIGLTIDDAIYEVDWLNLWVSNKCYGTEWSCL